jgi:hypothetical protein
MAAGLSFSPMNQTPSPGQTGQAQTNPLQDAIRMLSFRLPQNVGASAPSPGGIMGGPTALGGQTGPNPGLTAMLMALFRGMGLGGVPGQPGQYGGFGHSPGAGALPPGGASGAMLGPSSGGGPPVNVVYTHPGTPQLLPGSGSGPNPPPAGPPLDRTAPTQGPTADWPMPSGGGGMGSGPGSDVQQY